MHPDYVSTQFYPMLCLALQESFPALNILFHAKPKHAIYYFCPVVRNNVAFTDVSGGP